jgi:uncharacterized protein YcaQ
LSAASLVVAPLPVMPSSPISLDTLRRFAVARSLFAPTKLAAAIERLGFVQADPIRAPARAQDLILRHRVKGYLAGDLERRYGALDVEEEFFVNYGFLPRRTYALLHPRRPRSAWSREREAQAEAVLSFVGARGVVHPREVDAHFAHGRVRNWFGGSSNASTQLLDAMHYRGLLRIAGRVGGVRTYAVAAQLGGGELPPPTLDADQTMDLLVDVIVQKYAPLPERSLRELIVMLRGGAPQWEGLRGAAFARAKVRLGQCLVDGTRWYWPAGEAPGASRYRSAQGDVVRLLAPFDPVVWDRRRFELLWGWTYRFEAYTPAHKRVRGYYALPLLWRDQVIGWGNLSVLDGELRAELGYVAGKAPRERGYRGALAEELRRVEVFLGCRL